jgi:aminoglycoside/choline kinase family phosphotransferase
MPEIPPSDAVVPGHAEPGAHAAAHPTEERAAPSAVAWSDPARRAAFERWLRALAPAQGLDPERVEPASADASFRRYLRVAAPGRAEGSVIVMDAPPALEDVRPFMRVAALLRDAGLHVPEVLAADASQGFLLLTDLGREPYLRALQAADAAGADRLMRGALQALVQLQQRVPAAGLPPFDAALLQRELDLFPQWCVEREFGLRWGAAEQRAWQQVCERLVAAALAQPQVAVHADWMPRNLMVCPGAPQGQPGVLDFQDAVRGPIAYDLASLLRDAFLSWDEAQEIDWAVRGWELSRRAGLPVAADFSEYWRDLEWIGLQRHLKVMGIFCRLKHRDGKPAYAEDLPRFFAYAGKVALRYRALSPLLPLLEPLSGARVQPGFTF